MGTYLVTWKMRMFNQEFRNTFYYETTAGEPTDSEWTDIADEIRADLVSASATRWSDAWTWYGIDRRRVDTGGLLTFPVVPTGGDFDGVDEAEALPTQICLLISNKGTTTKPNRARTYLSGFVHDIMTDSQWESGIMLAMEELIDLQSDLNSIGTNPLQRVAAQWNTNHTIVTATNDLSGAASVASPVPATQRRRRIGVGI